MLSSRRAFAIPLIFPLVANYLVEDCWTHSSRRVVESCWLEEATTGHLECISRGLPDMKIRWREGESPPMRIHLMSETSVQSTAQLQKWMY